MTNGKWHAFVCPDCGARHVMWVSFDDLRLSADARALLAAAPIQWRRGRSVSVHVLADLAGMSYRRARVAMFELVGQGYAATIPQGKQRMRYVGVYTMIRKVEDKLAA